MGLAYKSFQERFFDVLDVEQELQTVWKDFTFIEGPVWNRKTQTLTFNDIPESRTYRYSEKDGLRLLRENTFKANGNACDMQGISLCVSM